LKPSTFLTRWFPLLALPLLSLIWGYTWVVSKQALAYAPPFAFAAERSLGGALALFVLIKLLRRPAKLVAPAQTVLIGLAQVTGFMLFQTLALVEGGPGKTSVLIFTMPIWVLLIAWPVLGERVRGKQWLAAISTLTGLVLIISPWDMQASLRSEFFAVMGALSWGIGTVLVKRLRRHRQVDLLSLTAWQMLIGAMPLVLMAGLIHERATDWSAIYAGILAFVSVISTGLGWWLWITILDRVPAWEASLSILGVPVVAIVSSRLIMSEQFAVSEMVGILLIGSGLALLSLFGWMASKRRR
jgi:drug/metabolite transporter (DMT)-like permease